MKTANCILSQSSRNTKIVGHNILSCSCTQLTVGLLLDNGIIPHSLKQGGETPEKDSHGGIATMPSHFSPGFVENITGVERGKDGKML